MPSIPPFLCLFCLLSLLFCNYFCLQSRLFCGYFAFYPTFSVAILPSIPPFLWLFCLLSLLFCFLFLFCFSYISPSVPPISHLLSLLYPCLQPLSFQWYICFYCAPFFGDSFILCGVCLHINSIMTFYIPVPIIFMPSRTFPPFISSHLWPSNNYVSKYLYHLFTRFWCKFGQIQSALFWIKVFLFCFVSN